MKHTQSAQKQPASKRLPSRNAWWLVGLGVITFLMAAFYLVVQQTMRYAADEPQRAMAQDTAYIVQHGGKPAEWSKVNVDMATDMTPFIIVYDQNGNVVSGSGYLNGEIPKVPFGVLQHADKRGENRVTWAPNKDVRIATVAVPAGQYYVLSGRSLAAVEDHLMAFGQWLATVWAVVVIGVAGAFLVATYRNQLAKD